MRAIGLKKWDDFTFGMKMFDPMVQYIRIVVSRIHIWRKLTLQGVLIQLHIHILPVVLWCLGIYWMYHDWVVTCSGGGIDTYHICDFMLCVWSCQLDLGLDIYWTTQTPLQVPTLKLTVPLAPKLVFCISPVSTTPYPCDLRVPIPYTHTRIVTNQVSPSGP